MLSGRAFRAQLVTQGQRELYDYWHYSAGPRRMPARSDLDPFRVPKLLPCIGLIDVTEGLENARFRLAGTGLREVYGGEITGKLVNRVFAGACADYWNGIHEQVIEDSSALHGVARGPSQGRDHIVLFWLRLPLSQDGARVDRILCYDTTAPIENVCATAGSGFRPYPTARPQPWGAPRRAQCG
jgi:hypothetical protein